MPSPQVKELAALPRHVSPHNPVDEQDADDRLHSLVPQRCEPMPSWQAFGMRTHVAPLARPSPGLRTVESLVHRVHLPKRLHAQQRPGLGDDGQSQRPRTTQSMPPIPSAVVFASCKGRDHFFVSVLELSTFRQRAPSSPRGKRHRFLVVSTPKAHPRHGEGLLVPRPVQKNPIYLLEVVSPSGTLRKRREGGNCHALTEC